MSTAGREPNRGMYVMPQYRKKPVVIEATQWAPPYNRMRHPKWFNDAVAERGGGISVVDGALNIWTLEGVMRAESGDWIIKGIKGEIYPCKPDIFEATYEPVL